MSNRAVQTVLGQIEASELGKTLTHEHLSLDFGFFYVPPPKIYEPFFDNQFNLRNIGVIRQYPYSSKFNIDVTDTSSADAVLEDVKFYKLSGGGTIVENTSHGGIKRNIPFMQKVSRETGIHVIAGTGHYVASTQTKSNLASSEEQLYDVITKELTEGCIDFPSVKAGFVGEVGSSWPIEDFEKRAIRATAQAQQQLNCPVSFHPGRNSAAPFEILRLFLEAGGNVKKTIMSHLDRTILKDEELLNFAELGSYCQFDLFGYECSYYQLRNDTDMPSDAQRLDKIKLLRDEGRLDKVLMSHDIHTKHRLMNFGGHGFSHIINNVLPKMLIKGFTSEEIDIITVTNPKTWLTS